MKKGCQGHGAVLRKGLWMHPVGTLCCYLTGMALRRTFLWRVIQAGSWRKVGQILRSSWVNGQLSREQDKEGHMKTLQGRGWLIIFLYLSYQFKISSELEILWRSALLYTLESCENCGLTCLHTCRTNTWFFMGWKDINFQLYILPEYHSHAISNRNWDFCSMCEPPKKGCGTWDIALKETRRAR